MLAVISQPLFTTPSNAQSDSLQAAIALENVLVKAIASSEQSVVAIARVRKREDRPDAQPVFPFGLTRQASPTDPDFIPNEFGAGVVVDDAGLILTTNHVLGDPEKSDYYIWSQHKPFKAEVVATAPWFDLAILKVEAGEFKAITFGDAADLRKGQIVLALGNPYAIARDGSVSASWGIISNLTRRAPRTPARSDAPQGRETLHHFGTLIQTDAKLNLGYSGGALLNLKGEMIGLTTSYAATAGYETAAGFAIPVDEHFKRAVDSLKKGESPEFGFLGVGPEPLDASLRRKGFHGARVVSVVAGTPAARAGIRAQDIIIKIDGQAVLDDSDLFRRIGALGPGSTALLTITRGDITDPKVATIETEVTVSKKHVATARTPVSTAQWPTWRGMRVDYATAAPSFNRLVVKPPGDSLFVAEVVPDSSAWEAGLRPGDFVTHVGAAKVTTPPQFAEAVANQADTVTLHITKDGRGTAARTVSP
jgi:serine protease Do